MIRWVALMLMLPLAASAQTNLFSGYSRVGDISFFSGLCCQGGGGNQAFLELAVPYTVPYPATIYFYTGPCAGQNFLVTFQDELSLFVDNAMACLGASCSEAACGTASLTP